MKNIDKFRQMTEDEILELPFGINKKSHKMELCSELDCYGDCLFYRAKNCYAGRQEWLNSEYQEIKDYNFTELEKDILKDIDTKYNYIVRDLNNSIWLFAKCPCKDMNTNSWCWNEDDDRTSVSDYCDICELPFINYFKCIKWENTEPCEFRKYLD